VLGLRVLLPGPFLRRRIRHSKLFWRVLAVSLVLEGLAGMAWFLFGLDKSPGHLHYGIALLATQIVALLAFICGGRAEQQQAWLTRLAYTYEARRSYYEDLPRDTKAIATFHTSTPCPSREVARLSSPEAMDAWREATRREIIDSLYATAFSAITVLPGVRSCDR